MKKTNTLYENIEFLLNQYKKELEIEEEKCLLEQEPMLVLSYKNIIIELECALKISIDKMN